jgi:hypothetical protein
MENRRQLLAFGIVMLACAHPISGQVLVGEFALQQKGAPVQITTVVVGQGDMYHRIGVKNVGEKPITIIQFGIVGYDEGDPSRRVLLRPDPVAVSVQPGATEPLLANFLPEEQYGKLSDTFHGAARFQLGCWR